MSTTVIEKGQQGSRTGFQDSFLLHKLHSLSGVFPIGFFMIFHLLANSYSLRGEMEFNTTVKAIGYLPFVFVIECLVIFIPIIFHAVYGLFITAEMQGPGGNMVHYAYGRNWLYWLQRVSGVVALAYICYHVWSTTGHRWGYELFGGSAGKEAGFRAVSYEAMAYRFAGWGYTITYIIGIAAASFHLGNGLFNFCIRWGIAIGREAQKIVAAIGWSVGFGLAFIAMWTALNFHAVGHHYDIKNAQGEVIEKNVDLRQRFSSLAELISQTKLAPAEAIPGAGAKSASGSAVIVPASPAAQ